MVTHSPSESFFPWTKIVTQKKKNRKRRMYNPPVFFCSYHFARLYTATIYKMVSCYKSDTIGGTHWYSKYLFAKCFIVIKCSNHNFSNFLVYWKILSMVLRAITRYVMGNITDAVCITFTCEMLIVPTKKTPQQLVLRMLNTNEVIDFIANSIKTSNKFYRNVVTHFADLQILYSTVPYNKEKLFKLRT